MSGKNTRIVQHKLAAIPHPKDRKLDQLQRQLRHNYKLDLTKDKRRQGDMLNTARFFWFRCQMEALRGQPAAFFTPALQEALITLHIARNDEEVLLLKKETKRPQHGRISQLEEQRKQESFLFGSKGLPAPDITCSETREILLDIWDGDAKLVSCVPPITVVRKNLPIAGELEALRALLRPIDEVRDAEETSGCSTARSLQFRREAPPPEKAQRAKATEADTARQTTVKSVGSDKDIARRGTEKRMLQAQKRQQLRRHAALAKSRNLTG